MFAFCLLSHFSVFSFKSFLCLAVNNCIEILFDFSAFFHVTRSFLYQSDCRTFQTSILKKQSILNLNQDIIQWLDILGASQLIKYFCLVMARYTPFFLDQSDSKILGISNSNNSRKVLVAKLFFCIWIFVDRSHISM